MSLICGHWEPFLQTWPASGMTRGGQAYELPTSALPTAGSESSSSRLLATPTVAIAKGGRPQDSKGKRDLRLDLLPERNLLPTPRATDGTKGGPNMRGSSGDLMLPSAVHRLLPTPRTSDTNGAGVHGDGGPDLRTAVTLLPTPVVNDMGEGKDIEDWGAWTEKMRTTHGNGNGHGRSLSIETRKLLPTPTVMDAASSGGSNPSNVTLTDAVVRTRNGTEPNPRHGGHTPGPSDDGRQSWDVPLPLRLPLPHEGDDD